MILGISLDSVGTLPIRDEDRFKKSRKRNMTDTSTSTDTDTDNASDTHIGIFTLLMITPI